MKKRYSGYVTVEYAVIFPIVIVCLLLLIYLGMLYYQQSLLQSVVSENVQNLALLWGYNLQHAEMRSGIEDRDTYLNEELYWQIFSNPDERKKKAVETVKNDYLAKSIIKPSGNIDVQIEYTNLLVHKKVGIRARTSYPMPFKGFFKLVGFPEGVIIDVYSETIINDPAEFIQNVDYLLQLYEETGAKDWVEDKFKPLANTLKEIKDYFR